MWAIFGILVLLGLVAIIVAKKGKVKQEPDYKAFFILGIAFMIMGFGDNTLFFILGLAYITIGLINKDKWKKYKKWSEMTKHEKNVKLTLIIGLSVLVIAGFIFYFLSN